MTHFAELLTYEQVKSIHEASLDILKNVGIQVQNQEARQRFVKHGCYEELESPTIKIPRNIIERILHSIPPTFTFHGRDPRFDRTIPDDGPLIATGSSAPYITDLETGQIRRSRSNDIAQIAYLINELPGYDIFSISVIADDAPHDQHSLSRFYPALKNCLKPVRGSAPDVSEVDNILKVGELIAGSEAAFWERPLVTFQYCTMISPLTMDVASTEKLMRFTERGIPSYGVVAPNSGVTAPLTLVGALALMNAEFLAQATLEQITRPGKPIIYDALPTVTDMRTGAYAPGAIETGILGMGCAQLARFYKIPSSGFIGLTNAKTNDAQSGFETGMSTTAAMLAGVDLLNMGGLLDALMVFDFPKAVIDNEIALMLKQAARGIQFSEENLAIDVIAETGPGGIFLDKDHTLQQMRTTALLPEIADRSPRDHWEAEKQPDAHSQAMQRVREILRNENPAVFSPDVDLSIRAEFEDLVSGDAGTMG